jgi:hypothetical protein
LIMNDCTDKDIEYMIDYATGCGFHCRPLADVLNRYPNIVKSIIGDYTITDISISQLEDKGRMLLSALGQALLLLEKANGSGVRLPHALDTAHNKNRRLWCKAIIKSDDALTRPEIIAYFESLDIGAENEEEDTTTMDA